MSLSPSHKLHGLDHLRALAILMVFCYHYPETEVYGNGYKYVDFFWSGVDLFFVLSGYLIASQLLKSINTNGSVPFRQFYLKRIFRIFPAYFAVVAIYFLIPGFSEQGRQLPPLWKFLTFTQNIGLQGGKFSHAWSLCVEEQFYIFFPLILFLLLLIKPFKKWLFVTIAVLFAFTCLLRWWLCTKYLVPRIEAQSGIYPFWAQWLYYFTPSRLDGLLSGIFIAAFTTYFPLRWQKIRKWGNVIFMIGVGILVAAFFLSSKRMSVVSVLYGFPVTAIGYGFIVMAAISPSCFLYKFNSKVTAWLATLSFSTYLIHKGIIHLCMDQIDQRDGDVETWSTFFICLAASLLAALLLRLIIERPFLKLRDKVIAD